MIFDEVQSGFGRTGRYWGFEHYGVLPDLICCGKGISSGLPVSAVIGRPDDHGSLPARFHDLDAHRQPGLRGCGVGQSAGYRGGGAGRTLRDGWARSSSRNCTASAAASRSVSGPSTARDWWLRCTSIQPGRDRARTAPRPRDIVRRCVEKGLLMFAPVGYGGASVKIAPPLIIDEEPLREGIAVWKRRWRSDPS